MRMATDEEILKLWKNTSGNGKQEQAKAIIEFYRLAEKEGVERLEKELLSDATIDAALKTFGWGRGDKRSTITTKAVVRETLRLAREKAGKQSNTAFPRK